MNPNEKLTLYFLIAVSLVAGILILVNVLASYLDSKPLNKIRKSSAERGTERIEFFDTKERQKRDLIK